MFNGKGCFLRCQSNACRECHKSFEVVRLYFSSLTTYKKYFTQTTLSKVNLEHGLAPKLVLTKFLLPNFHRTLLVLLACTKIRSHHLFLHEPTSPTTKTHNIPGGMLLKTINKVNVNLYEVMLLQLNLCGCLIPLSYPWK